MSENKKTPPKVPPQRIPRKPETSYAAQQYSPRPPTPPPAVPKETNKMALISLISGILGVVFGLIALCVACLAPISLLLGIAGAVTGYLGKKQIDDSGGVEGNRKMAAGGMVLGIVGVVLSVLALIIAFIAPFLWSGLASLLTELLY